MSTPQPKKVLHLTKVRMLSRGSKVASGIKITNVRHIRPSSPETVKKQEEDARKAQLQKEIVSRSRTCIYSGYECWAPVVSGRKYCGAHLLHDATAPITRCAYMYPAGDVCKLPAPLPDGRGPALCFDHARAALVSRQRSSAPRPPVVSTETLLNQLQHYVKVERPRTTSCASSVSVVSDPAEPELTSPVAVDPFKLDSSFINTTYTASILECGSGSDSDGECLTLGRDGNCRNSHYDPEVESVPTEDKPLWRAGIFTAEEAISETKSVLSELQAAYIRQAQRCHVMLKLARKDYLKALKLEKEDYCSINSQARIGPLNVRERRQLRKLKAFASYHRKHGVDAVLARKLHHKRTKSESNGRERNLPSGARCTFTEGGVRCPARVLPAARHCAKHILLDTNQVLYRACGDTRGIVSCGEPVARLPLPSARCRYHTDPPVYTAFTIKKDGPESDSETDTGTDVSMFEQDLAVTSLPS